MYNSIIAYTICFLVVVCKQNMLYSTVQTSWVQILYTLPHYTVFEARPPTPPSYSQIMVGQQRQTAYFSSLKQLIKNKDYVLLLIAIGLSNGIWNAFGIELNSIYLNYFPVSTYYVYTYLRHRQCVGKGSNCFIFNLLFFQSLCRQPPKLAMQ